MKPIRLLLPLLLLLGTSTLHADGMSLRQIAELDQLAEVAVSPGGRQITFTRTVTRDLAEEEDGPAWRELDLIDQGWVDGDRVGITGGSYGGYATAWGATYYSQRLMRWMNHYLKGEGGEPPPHGLDYGPFE